VAKLFKAGKLNFKDFIRLYSDGGGDPPAGPEPEPTPEPKPEPKTEPEPEPKTFDEKYVKELRDEAARYRTERKEAKEQAEKLQNQIKSIQKAIGLESEEPDAEKLEKELRTKESELRGLKIEIAFGKAAKKAGADEDLTYAVLHRKGALDALELDGNLASALDELIEQELKTNPKLKAEIGGTGNTGDTGGSSGSNEKVSFNDLFRKAAGRT
jgi:hypothetical protein